MACRPMAIPTQQTNVRGDGKHLTEVSEGQPRTQALCSGKERPWSELVTWPLQN